MRKDKLPSLADIAEDMRRGKEGVTILKPRIKRLIQECLSNPQLNIYVLTVFFNRRIKWGTIHSYSTKGKPVKCGICGQHNKTGYWCGPCIYPKRCCDCCILLGGY